MPKVLLVAPKFDEPTSFSYLWSRRLKQDIEKKGWEIIDIGGRRVTKNEVEEALRGNPSIPYIHYDHGSEDAHWGSETEAVVDLKNVDMLASRIVYCMNCLSARKLGVEAWKRGCVYVGYVEVFTFTTYDEQLFCEAANSGFIAYVEGERDWKRIKQIMIDAFNKAIDRVEDAWSKLWLRWDRDALRVYNGEQPESPCIFRKLALKIFGSKVGWKISRTFAWGLLMFLVGYGIALHDFAHQVWELKGTPFSVEGGYVGFALCLIGFILLTSQHLKVFK